MTSSSIPTTFPSTKSMFRKYSADSVLTDFLPMQINVNSMSLPANTLDICCHLKASPWPYTKSRSFKIGHHHKKSRIFNLSSALPTSTVVSLIDILKSLFRLYVVVQHFCVLRVSGIVVGVLMGHNRCSGVKNECGVIGR